MGKYRKRFNEKARSGMMAKQAALKRARNKQYFRQLEDQNTEIPDQIPPSNEEYDTNATILKPVTEEERLERKRQLQATLYSANEKESKMSRTKRKRLDKYIEHQLKREEKKVLFEKLSKTRIDTNALTSSKTLGKGKATRREEIVEALELEKQGRGDENTRSILYEERTVEEGELPQGYEFHVEPDEENGASSDEESGNSDNENDDYQSDTPASSFVDNRPAKFGGSGSGFGFGALKPVEKTSRIPKKKYSWRAQIEKSEKKQELEELEEDFRESDSEDEDSSVDEDNESGVDEDNDVREDAEKAEQSGDEFSGFSADEKQDNEVHNEEDEEEFSGDSHEESDEGSDEDSGDNSEDEPRLLSSKPKHTSGAEAFKQWAEEQVRIIEGRNEYVMPDLSEDLKKQLSKPTIREEDMDHSSDEDGYIRIDKTSKREAFFVEVNRPDDIQKQRVNLPVFSEEHRIMEAIYHHDCIVICGETGSGKTTQVPQFLYEAGFGNVKSPLYPGMIGVTQPRRVAAVSMSNRVKSELGDHGHRVGYKIRFDSQIKNEGQENGTALKFMTDGVLLREMMSDFLLTKYSSIILDEAHERNVNTDILIGMLSRVLKLRRKYHEKDSEKYKPLKLIIMSATLRVSDFSENKTLFSTPPPVLKVSARQYPVSVHFSKHTKFDYQEEAFKKACKIHKRLPPGGILIFLTGQSEITNMVKRLRGEFPAAEKSKKNKPIEDTEDVITMVNTRNADAEAEEVDLGVNKMLDGSEEDDYSEGEDDDEEGFEETLEQHQTSNDPLHVLPLYSLLPTNLQMRVFDPPPKGSRLCVIATNVAETSLTIPGIRYVIDCGRSKERKYNKETDVQSFEVDWISKASADQRAGRAGRTGPGHCYRLFSSAIYEDYFNQFSDPEILRMPVESTVLSMKSMGIDHIANFPFPSAPEKRSLVRAEQVLTVLGALDSNEKKITPLGKTMAVLPLSPRFAKILIVGNQNGCLPYIVALVSALSVGDPFIGEQELTSNLEDDDKKDEVVSRFRKSRALFSKLGKTSDALFLLSAVCAYDHALKDSQTDFLKHNFLREKIMNEILQLRRQISHIVTINNKADSIAASLQTSEMKLDVPNTKQIQSIKQMIASGFIDQIAIRSDMISSELNVPKNASIINIPYTTVWPVRQGDGHAYIHPNSILTNLGEVPPDFLVYQLLNVNANTDKTPKTRMKVLVDVSGKQLSNIAKSTPLLTYSKPLGNKYAPKNITPTKREAYVIPRFGASLGTGGTGWDLPVIKVVQEKKGGQWTTI